MSQRLDAIRDCLEGVVPAIMATCSADGTPNVAYLSQTEYVDGQHVALSYQFFNTTRRNILENPNARLVVTHPHTAERYRLQLRYLRTETAGPLFERMKAKLAGIASHTGMSGVFRLLGSDVYRVFDVERVPGVALAPSPPPRANLLAALRATATRLASCRDLDALFNETLACLESQFDVRHAMLLLLDGSGSHLYTIASRGYAQSGVGSEIPLGQGVIGVAAREATPIRIGYMTLEYTYGRAIRAAAAANGLAAALETEIPLPGLAESASQLAVPIRAAGRLLGVLYVESTQNLRFGYDDEDALVALGGQLGAAMLALQGADAGEDIPAPEPAAGCADSAPVVVRHYAADDSVFLDDDYLIKGVAGSIFWALVRDHVETGRNTFSNRELRLDSRIRLPDLSDNLEARLILLRRRLNERGACVRLDKAGRGRLQLTATRPLTLVEVGPS
ncbi:MAG TPA: GAF domain-containing protein [Aromatoleum sp.]|uniref:GAF domain-containing protein n=1 Tax=Aromatoleum sp. TaxID=2307007 RepID=UPI002B499972|nr:GAF domain-containing protein [Aromatoleum sp.]HJV28046.1 GAF domain-containing protein [Aromatoleum sp.]